MSTGEIIGTIIGALILLAALLALIANLGELRRYLNIRRM